MKLYNTLTRSLEAFKPLAPPTVSLYVRGPTVYDVPHIGHARSAYIFDVLRRYLTFRGYTVKFIRNVTDVDDKIIERAKQEPGTGDIAAKCLEVSERYLKSYHDTLNRLGIEPPTEEPHATKHVVPEMTDLISKLLMQGVAYEASGSVYFAVRKFEGYGTLSNRTLDELQAGTRVEPGEGKQDPLDFALWEAAKPGEPQGASPWGPGRPGWHIECSAMSTKYLGDTFDIHGGGVDLVFPHHENEIAQAQAAGKKFARYWVHNGLLTVNGEKMSKSLGNYITLERALEQSGHVDALKLFFVGAHYRSPLDYTESNVEAAGRRFDGLYSFLRHTEEFGRNVEPMNDPPTDIDGFRRRFIEAMDDDLNTPEALAVLDGLSEIGYQWIAAWRKKYDQIREADPNQIPGILDDPKANFYRSNFIHVAKMLRNLADVLGLSFSREGFVVKVKDEHKETVDPTKLFEDYKAARTRKDFPTSDKLRRQLNDYGFIVQDMGNTSILIPKR